MHIFCDFDGTISRDDTSDAVLSALADPAWERIEARWQAGEIDSATCMREQIAMIRGGTFAIDAVLDRIELTPGFIDFVTWARAEGLPVTIVSDGVDYFINGILARHGLRLPVIANRLAIGETGDFMLQQPHARAGCGSGVCKCAVLNAAVARRPIVFVGDGRSDFCASTVPDILFAKSSLARHCTAQGTDFIPYDDFNDVHAALEAIRQPVVRIAA